MNNIKITIEIEFVSQSTPELAVDTLITGIKKPNINRIKLIKGECDSNPIDLDCPYLMDYK